MSGKPAARLGDGVANGVIVQGSLTVLIGSQGGVACSVCPGGIAVGNPVNPALGAKVLVGEADLDFALPGALPLVWQRQYSSYVNADHGPRLGLLGFGWTLPFDLHFQLSAQASLLFDASGRVITFEVIKPGKTLYSPSEGIHLLRGGSELPQQLAKAREAAETHRRLASSAKPDLLAYAARWRALTSLSGEQLADPGYLFATSGSVVWAFRQTDAERFELSSLIDRYGRRQAYDRDDAGRLVELQDGVGRRYRLLYDNVHPGRRADAIWPADPGLRLVGVDLVSDPLVAGAPSRSLVRYRYNPEGDLTSVIDRHSEAVRSFAYRQHSLVFHRQRQGPEHRYTYESDQPGARVVEQHNEEGLSYRFDYQDAENAVVVTDSLGRTDRYQFQGTGGLKRLTEHLRADGSRLRYKCDAAGRLFARSDPLDRTTYFRLDAEGRPLGVSGPGGSTSTSFDARGRLVETKTSGGRCTRMSYDAWDRLVEVATADGAKTHYVYPDPADSPLTCEHPIEIIDAQGGIKRLSWNDNGQRVGYTDCSGRSTSYRYDRWGDLVEATDPLMQVTRYERDRQGRLVSIVQPDGSVSRYRYDAHDRLAEEEDALGRISAFSYDLWGRPTSRRQSGSVLALDYDLAGRLVTLTNENQAQTHFTYDPLDRLIREVGFDGRIQDYRYDAAGRLLEARDGNTVQQRTTAYAYDPADRLIERRTSCGALQAATTDFAEAELHRFAYDADGLLSSATVLAETTDEAPPKLSEVLIERDALGRPLTETQRLYRLPASPANGVEFEYRLAHRYTPLGHRAASDLPGLGELDWLSYGSGHVHGLMLNRQPLLDLDRDAGHREIARKLANGLGETRHLDPSGRLLVQSLTGLPADAALSQPRRYAYDAAGQLLGIRSTARTTLFGYDPLGRLVAMRRDAASEVRYRFDPAGNRLPVAVPETIRQTLPDWGDRVRENLDNPDFNLLGQDPAERTTRDAEIRRWPHNRIGHSAGIAYRYDVWGNRIEASHPDGTRQHFGYDGLHRLVEMRASPAQARYRYDAFGRRLAKMVTVQGETRTTWYGWDGDRLVRTEDAHSIRQTVYQPDSFVPLVELARTKGGRSATEALLATVNDDAADAQAMTAMLKLLPKEVQEGLEATLRKVAGEGMSQAKAVLPSDFDTSAAERALLMTRNTLAEDEARRPVRVRYFHCDHLGTPMALSDDQGMIVWRAEYDPWGNMVEEFNPDGIEQNIRFQGQHFDAESGLHYNRHRYYDPRIGTYVTQDPIGLMGGANVYPYPQNPNNWVDPMGLAPGDVFSSADAAAVDASKYARTQSPDFLEYGGWICKKGNGYTYSMIKGNPDKVPKEKMDALRLTCPSPVAAWHTHPWPREIPKPADNDSTQNQFSPGDKAAAKYYKSPVYLGAPSGTVRVVNPNGAERVVK